MYSTQLQDMTRLWHEAVQEKNKYLHSQQEAERLLIEVDARLHEVITRNQQLLREKDDAVEATRMMILRMQLLNLESGEKKRRCPIQDGRERSKKRSRVDDDDDDVETSTSSLGLELAVRRRGSTTPSVCSASCFTSYKLTS